MSQQLQSRLCEFRKKFIRDGKKTKMIEYNWKKKENQFEGHRQESGIKSALM